MFAGALVGQLVSAAALVYLDALVNDHIGDRSNDQSKRNRTDEHRFEHWPERVERFFEKALLKLLVNLMRVRLWSAPVDDPLSDFEGEGPNERERQWIADGRSKRCCYHVAAHQVGKCESGQEMEADKRRA